MKLAAFTKETMVRTVFAQLSGVRRAATLLTLAIHATVFAQIQELPVIGHVGTGVPIYDTEVAGTNAYIGENDVLTILNVSTPTSPEKIGSVVCGGTIWSVLHRNGIVYVGHDTGMDIVLVVDPHVPEVIGSFQSGKLRSLAVHGEAVLAVEEATALHAIDVTTPSAPTEISSLPISSGGRDVVLQGDLAYTGGTGLGVFYIIDVSDHANMQIVGSLDTATDPYAVAVEGTLAYLASASIDLRIVDVSDPANPAQVGFLDLPALDSYAVSYSNGIAYLSSSGAGSGLHAVDVSDPMNPVEIGFVAMSSAADNVELAGNYAFFNGGFEGLRVVDVSNPGAPAIVAALSPIAAAALHAQPNRLYVADSAFGLRVIDTTDPENVVEIGSLATNPAAPTDIAVLGNFAYLTVQTVSAGLRVIDISDPTVPVAAGALGTGANALGVDIVQHYAYVVDSGGGMHIVDVTSPASPTEIGTFTGGGGTVSDVVVVGNYAYFANGASGLRILDISDPTDPTEVGLFNATVAQAESVDVDGAKAYLADGSGHLRILDVSNMSSITELGVLAFGSEATSVKVLGRTAYVTATGSGVHVVDVSNSAAPVDQAMLDTVGSAQDAFLANLLYVADGVAGVTITSAPPPAPLLNPIAPFIDSSTIAVSGSAEEGSFVAVGGGVEPRFQQLAEGTTVFSIEVELTQEAVSTISVTTMNEFGLVSLPAIARVVEGPAYPSVVTAVTALAVTPSPAAPMALNDTLAFACTATFSNAAQADVSQFVQWEDVANGEVITPGGLYLNNKTGTAQVRAFVAGVFSNVVSVTDAP